MTFEVALARKKGGGGAGTGFRGHAIIMRKGEGGGESGNEAIQYEVLYSSTHSLYTT